MSWQYREPSAEERVEQYRGPLTACARYVTTSQPRIWDSMDPGAFVRAVTGCNQGHPEHEMRGFWHIAEAWWTGSGRGNPIVRTTCGLEFNPDDSISPERPPPAESRWCDRECGPAFRQLGFVPTGAAQVGSAMRLTLAIPGSWDGADWPTLRAAATDIGVRFGSRARDT